MYKIICAGILYLISSAIYAQYDGVVTGKISQIHMTNTNNYSYRVVLEGTPKLCGNEHVWAYLNTSDSNYAADANAILMAKIENSKIQLHSKKAKINGYCHIGYALVSKE